MGLFSKEKLEAEAVEVAGRVLKCLICGHDRFNKREAVLNTFLDFDWANAAGECQVCDNCGYIHWFLTK